MVDVDNLGEGEKFMYFVFYNLYFIYSSIEMCLLIGRVDRIYVFLFWNCLVRFIFVIVLWCLCVFFVMVKIKLKIEFENEFLNMFLF